MASLFQECELFQDEFHYHVLWLSVTIILKYQPVTMILYSNQLIFKYSIFVQISVLNYLYNKHLEAKLIVKLSTLFNLQLWIWPVTTDY